MVNVIMHGCNGKMGRNIAALIADDPEITLAAGVDAFDEGKNPFPVFTGKFAFCHRNFRGFSIWISTPHVPA